MGSKLKSLSYYSTGGDCAFLYEPASEEELQGALSEIQKNEVPLFFLGGGSNSLVMDEPWEGAVVSFRKLIELEMRGTTIHCGAGVGNTTLSTFAYEHGLEGIAWMHRLPGQLGGTVRMNARCYGGEISRVVEKVYTLTLSGERKIFVNQTDRSPFQGYKDTIFMKTPVLITGVDLQLRKGKKEEIHEKMLFCENDRESKGQFLYPSCGCVFKNDYRPEISVPSGLLLELAGVKEFKEGGAEVSPQHANFVFNKNKASSRDILQLSLHMRERVWKTFGVWLEYEMEILGNIPHDLLPLLTEKRLPHFQKQNLEEARSIFSKRQ